MPDDIYPENWERDETDLWTQIAADRVSDNDDPFVSDDYAIALFDAGWTKGHDELEPWQRGAIRDQFLDYAVERGFLNAHGEFDWDEWREYMGYGQD